MTLPVLMSIQSNDVGRFDFRVWIGMHYFMFRNGRRDLSSSLECSTLHSAAIDQSRYRGTRRTRSIGYLLKTHFFLVPEDLYSFNAQHM